MKEIEGWPSNTIKIFRSPVVDPSGPNWYGVDIIRNYLANLSFTKASLIKDFGEQYTNWNWAYARSNVLSVRFRKLEDAVEFYRRERCE